MEWRRAGFRLCIEGLKMKDFAEIKEDKRLRNIVKGEDGGKADIHIGGWDGSIIWSNGAGFEHVSVSPYKKNIVPQWGDMCNIKDIFWKDDEAVIQIHPKKTEYVNNVENCLHLWRCTYRETPLPPSCLIGLRKNQTMEELKKEIEEAYAEADKYIDKEWRDIKGYEGLYQVSDKGNVRHLSNYDSAGCFRDEYTLKPILSNHGYYEVSLYKNGKAKQYRVHRLVAEAFIPNPENYPMINHKDEVRTNNNVENLEWCDVSYNNNYGSRLSKVTKKLGFPIVSINLKTGEKHFYPSINIAANSTNSSARHISSVIKGERKTHHGMSWRYATEQEVKAAYALAGEEWK